MTVKSRVEVRLCHLSDLHFGDKRYEAANSASALVGRYSCDPDVAGRVAKHLRSLDLDIVAVTGDMSRSGTRDQLYTSRAWLITECGFGGESIQLLVVPGNHDAFAGEWAQRDLRTYEPEFPDHPVGTEHAFDVEKRAPDGRLVRIPFVAARINTTRTGGGKFGAGEFSLPSRPAHASTVSGTRIALLHHPPFPIFTESQGQFDMRMSNEKEAIRYLLSREFDCILFGHTHDGYFEQLPGRQLGMAAPRLRGKRRLALFAMLIGVVREKFGRLKDSPQTIGDCLAVLQIDRHAKNGDPVRLSSIVDMLVIQREVAPPDGVSPISPGAFNTPQHYYEHIEKIRPAMMAELPSRSDAQERGRTCLSMSPASIGYKAQWRGVNVLRLCYDVEADGPKLRSVLCELHSFDGDGRFTGVTEHDFYAKRTRQVAPR